MRKIFLCVFLIVSLLTIGCVYATDVSVKINGRAITFEDTNAQIINNRTMVPFRKIFNELGVSNDDIDWNGDTKTIIAQKDQVEIKLQIGNAIAEKKLDNNTTKITLDSEPVIINGRTLVPLRFIAESLGKIVSWDSNSKTAIINDEGYVDTNINTNTNTNVIANTNNDDYYMNAIKNKSPELYNFLKNQSDNMKVNITRNYTDYENSRNNDTAVVNINIAEKRNGNSIHQDTSISFSGSNDLMKDISSEGWSNIHYENDYYDTYFTTKALTDGLKKVYGQEQLKFMYTGLNCNGKNTYTVSDLLKEISSNEQSAKSEFDALLNKLKSNGNGVLTTGNISSDSIEINNFDLTKLDNTMFNSPFNRVWCFLNSQIFNYDITWEELRYDYRNMNLNINVNNLELTIDFILTNDYNEKVEYIVKINK